ncbi:MAG: response regulator, partial [Bacteroidia bacterium]|nr:response regulator [Bacteroidia bacterium]
MEALKILIVEDEFIIARNLQVILEDLGYEPLEPVGTKKAAIAAIDELEIDLVILDINLNGKHEGIEIGKYL